MKNKVNHRLFFWLIPFILCNCAGPDLLQLAKKKNELLFGVHYIPQGAESGVVPLDSSAYRVNQSVKILGNTGNLAKSGYIFSGWGTTADGTGNLYAVGRTFAHPAFEVLLYAVWASSSTMEITGTTICQGTIPPTGRLIIPDGVTETAIGAFSDCTGLTSVTTPATMTTLGNSTFMGCTNLTSADLNEGLTVIGSSAFQESGLVSLDIPSTVTTIGSNAFYSTPLSHVTIPPGVTDIGSGAFQGTNLTEITLPQGLTQISSLCFASSMLSSIVVPSGVTSIGSGAFSNCTPLQSVTLPPGPLTIDSAAFHDCEGLTQMTLPAGVTYIGDYAFQDCANLADVYMEGVVPPVMGGSLVFDNCAVNFRVHVPTAAALTAYSADPLWNIYLLVTP